MKLYTTQDQTTRLIDLGFEKPKSIVSVSLTQGDMVDMQGRYDTELEYERAYSIGELIEMLPKTITSKIWWGGYKGKEGVWGLRIQTCGTEYSWEISYVRENSAHLYLEGRSELVDALYDMIVKLKEEGVI